MLRKVFLFLLMVLIISGCTNNQIDEDIIKLDQKENEVVNLNIIYPRNMMFPVYETDNWEKYIKDEFNLNINLEYVDILEKNNLDSVFKGKSGLVYLASPNDLKLLKDNNLIEPINDYVDNDFRSLNLNSFRYFSDNEDNIWAVSTGHKQSMKVRLYNKQWMSELNALVPADVNELYDVLYNMTHNDPDNDGTDNTCGIKVNTGDISYYIDDILHAFGFYMSRGNLAVAFNPLTESYEDAVFSDNTVELLNYLDNMFENNIIIDTRQEEILSGSTYDSIYRYNLDKNPISVYLQGINNRKLIETDKYLSSFALLKGTEDPAKKFEALDKTFYTTLDGNYLATYGIPKIDFKVESSGKISMLESENNKDRSKMVMPISTQYSSSANIRKDIIDIKESIPEDLTYSVGAFYTLNDKDEKFKKIINSFNANIIFNDKSKGLSADERIDSYKKEFKRFGGLELLDNLNQQMNKELQYEY